MKQLPSISIVVPSFNQAQYLGETLQSLIDQEYPNLQVIIQDGGSTDGCVDIAEDFVRRYPEIFQLFVEKDSGQADAINRGFARTNGEILAFLNSDDTYFPRILHQVATEIDPSRNRFVVMGRCLFTGENSRYVGVEHPAEYACHFEHLAIWKRGFNTIPQPSIFWQRTVWDQCGGLDVNEHHALDYDLFCRFSEKFDFHRVDEMWSTYRMHDASKSAQRTEAEVLELSIQVSRKHWGSWLSLLHWRCVLSYWLYRRHSHEHARHHARRAEEAFRKRQLLAAFFELLHTLRYSPAMACDRLLCGWLAGRKVWLLDKLIVKHEEFTGRYADGWIGPNYREQLCVPADGRRVVVTATHHPQRSYKKVQVQLFINGALVDAKMVKNESTFSLATGAEPYRGQTVTVEVRTNSSFTPAGGVDRRRLSLQLVEIKSTAN